MHSALRVGFPVVQTLQRTLSRSQFTGVLPLEFSTDSSAFHRFGITKVRRSTTWSCPSLASFPTISGSYPGFSAKDSESTADPETSMDTKLVVGTHNGSFHCDEALGCFMIRRTEKFKDAAVVRTRDENVLASMAAVLDVGGVYDPATHRYDHHQRGFSEVFGHGFSTKLSSAGLVYKHFGKEVVAKEMGLAEDNLDVEAVYLACYRTFMEAIDAIDNGVNQFDAVGPPKYENNTYLSARVGRLNPSWTVKCTQEIEDAAFHRAVEMAGTEFLECVRDLATSWLPARTIVVDSLKSRITSDESGEIVVLKQFCPWKSHLHQLEEEMSISPLIKYVLYEDERSKQWRVQAVAVSPGSFESRLPFPEAWRGLREQELCKMTGIHGCVFVHISGFIGGNQTLAGALDMARRSLRWKPTND